MLDAIIVGQVIQRVREEKQMSQELVSGLAGIGRSEERRVGKECRSRWSPYH